MIKNFKISLLILSLSWYGITHSATASAAEALYAEYLAAKGIAAKTAPHKTEWEAAWAKAGKTTAPSAAKSATASPAPAVEEVPWAKIVDAVEREKCIRENRNWFMRPGRDPEYYWRYLLANSALPERFEGGTRKELDEAAYLRIQLEHAQDRMDAGDKDGVQGVLTDVRTRLGTRAGDHFAKFERFVATDAASTEGKPGRTLTTLSDDEIARLETTKDRFVKAAQTDKDLTHASRVVAGRDMERAGGHIINNAKNVEDAELALASALDQILAHYKGTASGAGRRTLLPTEEERAARRNEHVEGLLAASSLAAGQPHFDAILTHYMGLKRGDRAAAKAAMASDCFDKKELFAGIGEAEKTTLMAKIQQHTSASATPTPPATSTSDLAARLAALRRGDSPAPSSAPTPAPAARPDFLEAKPKHLSAASRLKSMAAEIQSLRASLAATPEATAKAVQDALAAKEEELRREKARLEEARAARSVAVDAKLAALYREMDELDREMDELLGTPAPAVAAPAPTPALRSARRPSGSASAVPTPLTPASSLHVSAMLSGLTKIGSPEDQFIHLMNLRFGVLETDDRSEDRLTLNDAIQRLSEYKEETTRAARIALQDRCFNIKKQLAEALLISDSAAKKDRLQNLIILLKQLNADYSNTAANGYQEGSFFRSAEKRPTDGLKAAQLLQQAQTELAKLTPASSSGWSLSSLWR